MNIRKFVGNQFREATYKVKPSELLKVPSQINNKSAPMSHPSYDDDDNDAEEHSTSNDSSIPEISIPEVIRPLPTPVEETPMFEEPTAPAPPPPIPTAPPNTDPIPAEARPPAFQQPDATPAPQISRSGRTLKSTRNPDFVYGRNDPR